MERNQIQEIAFQHDLGRRQRRRQPGQPLWIAFFQIYGITDKRSWYGFAGEPLSDQHRTAIEQAAQSDLDARAQFANASLADLYDPLTTRAGTGQRCSAAVL